jgi:hypothetical protein
MDNENPQKKVQKILVFQQKGSGVNKISGLKKFGGKRFIIETYDIDEPLPGLIENGNDYLPETIDADLVLDYLKHLDLSNDLWLLCEKLGIPVVASNKKTTGKWAMTPRTCCALPPHEILGEYGKMFGGPEFEVEIKDGMISDIKVIHGAPCGATWEAAAQTQGVPVEEAPVHIGLRTQYFCSANPAGWDVMYGKSPVHFAAELHTAALVNAIERFLKNHGDDGPEK